MRRAFHNQKQNSRTKDKQMKKNKYLLMILAALFGAWDRMFTPRNAIALPNEIGLIDPHGNMSLALDPNTASLATASAKQYLLYKRGATGNQYCDVCGAADMPLGPSPDSPDQILDQISIYRLGRKQGNTLGVPATAILADELVLTAANGQVQGLSQTANGTYWCVGRCEKAVAAGAKEVVYAPMTPRKLTVNNNAISAETIA